MFAGFVALVVALYLLGALDPLLDLDRFVDTVRSAGAFSYAVYLAIFIIVQPFGVPGTLFLVAGTMMWPPALAFGLGMIGGVGAAIVGFLFARYLGRDWVAARIPERFRRYDDAIAARGLFAIVIIRLITLLNPVVHWFLGLSKIPVWTYVIGTAIGVLPGVFLWTVLGHTAKEWLTRYATSPAFLLAVGALALALTGGWLVLSRRRK